MDHFFEYAQIKENEAKEIAEALKLNNKITTIELNNQSIRELGAKYLCEALKSNDSVTKLTLNNNHIGENGAKSRHRIESYFAGEPVL